MIRKGNVITTPGIASALDARVFSIKSWDNNGFATKTAKSVRTLGLYIESVYSPAGRNYLLFLLPDSTYRRAAFQCAAGEVR